VDLKILDQLALWFALWLVGKRFEKPDAAVRVQAWCFFPLAILLYPLSLDAVCLA